VIVHGCPDCAPGMPCERHPAMPKTYLVYRQPQSRQWGVYETSTGYNRLVEGGFFSRSVADAAREWWKLNGFARQ
jgi:hypothetical protein